MTTNVPIENETPHFGNTMLDAAVDGLRKFVWVGWNKHFQNYWVSETLTTRQLLEGKYPSFFNIENDNCIFVMEIFEGDTLIYYSQNSMSSMTVKIENGVFVGEGPFNTHPLEVYFNATDFVNMERAVSGTLLERAMLTLDDYLNAGCKETRRNAAENAKFLYKEYYGVDYVNRNDR